jgi:hypothetical protein
VGGSKEHLLRRFEVRKLFEVSLSGCEQVEVKGAQSNFVAVNSDPDVVRHSRAGTLHRSLCHSSQTYQFVRLRSIKH